MRTAATILAIMTTTGPTEAETPIDPRLAPATLAAFEARVFDGGELPIPYRLLRPPEARPGTEYPLVLFLHGMGERGGDNQRQLVHGGALFASEEFRRRHSAFVVAPQCPAGVEPGAPSSKPGDPPGTEAQRVWTLPAPDWNNVELRLDVGPTRQLSAVRALIDALREELPIDDRRLYLCGLSMGGYATWELATREPDLWAAAIPICGGGDPRHADRLTRLPIWCFHGEADSVVPASCSRAMVDAINAAGGRAVYTEFPGVNHFSWTPVFRSRYAWDWLFAQRR